MAGPLEELVSRIHRRIEAFAAEHGVEAMVEIELSDGALHRLESISSSPASASSRCDRTPPKARRS